MLHFGAGAAGRLGERRQLQIGPEATVSLVLDDVQRRTTNAEGLLGARWRFLEFLRAGVGAGPGFTSGVGTPDFRAVVSLEYVPPLEQDRDRDGIADDQDACPQQPGQASADPARHGCPPPSDRDADGIWDELDACPDQPGVKSEQPAKHGCPDRDGDGVLDGSDACPDEVGVPSDEPSQNGCPADADRDGILDSKDACPTEPGVPSDDPKRNGCPADADGDGVLDQVDACPQVAGVKSGNPACNGCPDVDGDGITDAKDACPQEQGRPNQDPARHGCPAVKVTTGQIVILQRVQFDTNQATIKPVSAPLLDEIADVMRDHTEILRVEVQGHTDDRGGWQHNLRLSKERAEAVMAALVARGVDPGRLTAKGHGPREPVATNATAEGREQNRRVEFKITERKEK
jgi:outer membrane protein OmpA-like peptidoglycan-associated protein